LELKSSMKKLLLTSNGFTNQKILHAFKNLVGKELSDIKVLYIPTACRANSAEALAYISASKNNLVTHGITKENITEYNLDSDLSDLSKYNAVYVGGGNTFYLLHRIKETGFDKKLISAIENGLTYVGVSAGSIITGPTIETAGPFDENDIGITDFRGMNLTDTILIPHYSIHREKIVADFRKSLKHEIIAITDTQAIFIHNEKTQIIGEP